MNEPQNTKLFYQLALTRSTKDHKNTGIEKHWILPEINCTYLIALEST